LTEDVRKGNLTPAQADQLLALAVQHQERQEAAKAELKAGIMKEFERGAMTAVLREANRQVDVMQTLGNLDLFDPNLDPKIALAALKADTTPFGHLSDREMAATVAAFTTSQPGIVIEMELMLARSETFAKFWRDEVGGIARIMDERARMIAASPTASERERNQAAFEARTVARVARDLESSQANRARELERKAGQLLDARVKIELALDQRIRQYGRDPTDWPPPGHKPPAPRPAATGQPAPARPVPVAPQPDPIAAPAPSAGPAPVRTVSKGVIPGANGDPFEGLRVPSNLGGTGARTDTPSPPRQATPQPPPPAMDQAEANALRTERLRQQAMQNTSDLNDQLDRQWRGDPEPADRIDDFEFGDRSERMIPLQIRPHPGGGGAVGGEGFGGLDSQLADGSGFVEDWGTLRPDWPDWPKYTALDAGTAFAEMLAEYRAIEAETAAFIDSWRSFELGGTLTVAELLPIYAGWDPMTAPIGSSGRSLSAAGTSPSAAGNSPSAAGASLSSAGTSLSSAGTSLSSMGMSLSAAGSAMPSLWPYTPSAAPQGYAPNWGAGFSPTDPFRVSNATGPAQFRLPPGADPGPSLCGR
jgi:hypothetical protein